MTTTFLTLADGQKFTRNMLLRGVIEQIVTESAILDYLPFMDVVGSGLTYNRELTLAAAPFNAVNGTWTQDAPTFAQQTATLAILGGDADVDNFMVQTYRDTNDLRAIVLQEKAKSVAYAFKNTFFNGDTGSDANSFNGLDKLTAAGQSINVATNGGALTLDLIDQLIDLVKPGKPDALFVSRRTRRKMKALRRANGQVLESDMNSFGRRIDVYDGIPVVTDDILDTKTVGSSGAVCSTIYAAKFGAMSGVSGLHNGGIMVEEFPKLETKDGTRIRIKWYVSIACFSDLSLAKLGGINAS